MNIETYPNPKTFLTFDDKKAAKFASPLAITGFADFESKFDCINNANDKFKDVIKTKKSFTIRKDVHSIVSFNIIFIDTNGLLLF